MPKFLSLNAKGLNHPTNKHPCGAQHINIIVKSYAYKRHILKWIQNPTAPTKTLPTYIGQGPAKKNGVLIAIMNTIALTLHDSLVDTEGRYLTLNCTLDNTRCTIINVCAPSSRQVRFISKLMKRNPQIPPRSSHYVRWFQYCARQFSRHFFP